MKIYKQGALSIISNKHLLVLLLLIFIQTNVGFSDSFVDSLSHLLESANDSDRIEILTQLSKKTNPNSPVNGFNYANEALHLANKYNDKKGKADAFNMMAYSWLYRGQYDTALYYYFKSNEVCKELNDTERTGNLYFSLGQVYYFKGDSEIGLDYYLKAMKAFKLLNNINGLSKTMYSIGYMYYDFGRYDSAMYYFINGINMTENVPDCKDITTSLFNGAGNVFYDWGKYDKAIEYYNKALVLNKIIDNKPGVAYGINNMGNVYYNWRKYDSAFINYNNAYTLFLEIGNVKGQAIELHNMGLICDATAKYDSSFSYYEKALEIYKEIGHPAGIAETLNEMGESYKKAGNFKKAIQLINQSQEYAMENNLAEVIFDNYHILSVAYSQMGKPILALEYFKKYTAVKDSLFNEKMYRQISELETRYKTEQKDKKIILLSKENQLNKLQHHADRIIMLGLAGFVTMIILFGVVLFRKNKLKANQQYLLLKQKLLRSQMNPHFIFNSLASIQNFIINEEPLKASKYLARFSKLVRSILDSSVEDLISLEEEIITIENYLVLQKIRFPEEFDYTVNVDEHLDPESIYIPPMLAQPFIENAIEHGIKHKNTKGNISVRFKYDEDKILYEVEDDGVGRKKAHEILMKYDKDHKSLAIEIMKERIRILKKKLKTEISLSIEDLKNENGEALGTKVLIQIPYEME